MTQHKAASLTSNLFARKGRASPASLLIAEIEGAAPEERELKPKRAANGVRKIELNGHAAKKAKEAEELPLLAFVEAQAAEEEKVAAGKTEAGKPRETAEADAAAPEAGALEEPRPPASLLDSGARALRQANGRRVPAKPEGPAAAENDTPEPATPVTAALVAADVESAVEIEAEMEAETVSGDENVAAIEDAPHDDVGPQDDGEPQGEGEKAEAVGSVAAEVEAVEAETAEAAETATEETGEEKAVAGSGNRVAEPEAKAPLAAEPETAGSAPGTATATPAAQKLGTEAAISATVALRHAAASRATPMPSPTPQRETAATPAPAAAAPKPEGGALPWRSAAVVALGIALGLGAYVIFSGGPETPPAQTPAPVAAPVPAPVAETLPAEAATAAKETAAEVAAPPAATPESVTPESAAPEPPAAAVQVPEPSFDIIRIEPDGQSIIAGRAAPGSEWILLNNGDPIASVQADANGEWVVLPDASLVPGANAFSLVPKTERGKVAIPAPAEQENLSEQPAPEAPAAPQSGSDSGAALTPQAAPELDVAVALPKPKPAVSGDTPAPRIQVSQDGVYELQVASVRQSADAERERSRLAAAYPDLLGALQLRVQEASVDGAGTFFRVRSGAIADLGAARDLCRRLEAAGQGCLVVRRPPPAEVPQTEVVQDGPAAPASAPEQQAQRP